MAISVSPTMPRPYSDDLRCKLLQVYERSDIGLEELAEQFGVSYGYTKKIRRQQLQSGQRERVPQSRYGPVSRVSAAVQAQLGAELRRQPDLTLAELGERLQHSLGLRLSKTRWSEVLLQLGLRRKKNRFTRPSRTAKQPGGAGKHGAKQ
jgi:transposase